MFDRYKQSIKNITSRLSFSKGGGKGSRLIELFEKEETGRWTAPPGGPTLPFFIKKKEKKKKSNKLNNEFFSYFRVSDLGIFLKTTPEEEEEKKRILA